MRMKEKDGLFLRMELIDGRLRVPAAPVLTVFVCFSVCSSTFSVFLIVVLQRLILDYRRAAVNLSLSLTTCFSVTLRGLSLSPEAAQTH